MRTIPRPSRKSLKDFADRKLTIGQLVRYVAIGITAALAFFLVACTSSPSAQDEAINRSQTRQNYVPTHDVEGQNYNARQRISDDPATLLWCTAYPANPNAKPTTYPIVGKLTSGNKRPYATSRVITTDSGTTEVPGPDGFYGSSGDYRYGFDPAGNYVDFTDVATICSTVPSIVQKNKTDIAITATGDLTALDAQAQKALTACRAANPDPSVPCKSAANILGVN